MAVPTSASRCPSGDHVREAAEPLGRWAMSDATEARVRVLLVEDNDSDADLFEVSLGDAATGAFDVARVDTLASARAFLEKNSVACAVVDLLLPDAEGVEVVSSLAACSPATALVVLTGREDDELGLATVEAGASDYFPKSSLDGKLIARSIRYAIVRKRLEVSLAESQSIARVGSWDVDIASGRVTWSRELYRVFGFSSDESPHVRGAHRSRSSRRSGHGHRGDRGDGGRPHPVLDRTSAPAARRNGAVGPGARSGRAGCFGSTEPAARHGTGHLGPEGGRRRVAAPGVARSTDWTSEPSAVPRPAGPCPPTARASAVDGGRDLHRHRSVQGDQRQLGPRGRR